MPQAPIKALFIGLAIITISTCVLATNAMASAPRVGPDSGKPVPRFESLKYGEVNGRQGPSTEHRLLWTYHRRGLPVEIVAESGGWRQIRDPAGELAWISGDKLEDRRTTFVKSDAVIPLYRTPQANGKLAARVGPGMVMTLKACRIGWRQVQVGDREGWVEASALWGADDCVGIPD